jgi:hypothetical protein
LQSYECGTMEDGLPQLSNQISGNSGEVSTAIPETLSESNQRMLGVHKPCPPAMYPATYSPKTDAVFGYTPLRQSSILQGHDLFEVSCRILIERMDSRIPILMIRRPISPSCAKTFIGAVRSRENRRNIKRNRLASIVATDVWPKMHSKERHSLP